MDAQAQAAAQSVAGPVAELVAELRDIRKVFRQVLAPEERQGWLKRLFAGGGETPKAPEAGAEGNVGLNGGSNGGSNGDANGGIEVLRGVTLSIGAGEFVALQGTSGSGKSTLLHLMGLLDTPTSGTYRLLGRDVSGLDDEERSRLRNTTLGFVFQSFYLVPYATALENVMLPGMYSGHPQAELKARAEELLGQVGLADRVNFRPANLSGGQQQRVAMARALLNRPRLILADEPTGQLDSTTSADIMRLFAEVNQTGTAIVLVTHDENVAARAGRIIRMADGLLVPSPHASGPRTETPA